jgi:hypothetical protein
MGLFIPVYPANHKPAGNGSMPVNLPELPMDLGHNATTPGREGHSRMRLRRQTNASRAVRSNRCPALIHIALITLFRLEPLDVLPGLLRILLAGGGNDLLQCRIHVLRHPIGIATNIKMRPRLKPGE